MSYSSVKEKESVIVIAFWFLKKQVILNKTLKL